MKFHIKYYGNLHKKVSYGFYANKENTLKFINLLRHFFWIWIAGQVCCCCLHTLIRTKEPVFGHLELPSQQWSLAGVALEALRVCMVEVSTMAASILFRCYFLLTSLTHLEGGYQVEIYHMRK